MTTTPLFETASCTSADPAGVARPAPAGAFGSQGMVLFNEVLASVSKSKPLFTRRHSLQLAALKRRAVRHDLLGDWQPLIDRAFAIQSDALGVKI